MRHYQPRWRQRSAMPYRYNLDTNRLLAFRRRNIDTSRLIAFNPERTARWSPCAACGKATCGCGCAGDPMACMCPGFQRGWRRNPAPNGDPWGPKLYNPLEDDDHEFLDDSHYQRTISKLRRNPRRWSAKPWRRNMRDSHNYHQECPLCRGNPEPPINTATGDVGTGLFRSIFARNPEEGTGLFKSIFSRNPMRRWSRDRWGGTQRNWGRSRGRYWGKHDNEDFWSGSGI